MYMYIIYINNLYKSKTRREIVQRNFFDQVVCEMLSEINPKCILNMHFIVHLICLKTLMNNSKD